MANEFFRRCVQTNADVLGTGRYHDGIKAIAVDSGVLTVGGWDGLNSPDFTYNDQHSSTDYFATVNTLSAAPWNRRHSYGFDTDSNGDGWLFGSDPYAPVSSDRQQLWKINKTTLAWSLINSTLPTSDRILFGFGIDKNTNKKYIFGGQVGFYKTDGTHDDIIEVSADGLSYSIVKTGCTMLAGNNDGMVCWDPVRSVFHLVCTGGAFDSDVSQRTWSKTHYTYDPVANTLTQLADFPGDPRQYGNLIWHDGCLWMVNGYTNHFSSYANVAEIWYWNGNDWAKIVAKSYNSSTSKGISHATAIYSYNNKMGILMGNENPTAWYMEKYEKPLT